MIHKTQIFFLTALFSTIALSVAKDTKLTECYQAEDSSEEPLTPWSVKTASEECDYAAPDGLAVFLGAEVTKTGNASVARFELPPRFISQAVTHKTVDEIWYCIEGRGELWLKDSLTKKTEVVEFKPGTSVSIPLGTHFQSRNTGDSLLKIIGFTTPKWPGDPSEAVFVEGYWER